MSTETAVLKEHSNSYDIFILVLTIMSLAVMVLLLLPLDSETIDTLRFYDNAICVVFLVDFFGNLAGARNRRTPTSSDGADGSTSSARSRASGSSPRQACFACSD